jgi:hypothetical protein
MGPHQRMSARLAMGIAVAVVLAAGALVVETGHARSPTRANPKLEASIFSYDGKEFVRTKTTLMTEAGKSAVGTKLDHGTPGYKALIDKHSYSGDATVLGKKYDANYAPLMDKDGKLTGALFVGAPE